MPLTNKKTTVLKIEDLMFPKTTNKEVMRQAWKIRRVIKFDVGGKGWEFFLGDVAQKAGCDLDTVGKAFGAFDDEHRFGGFTVWSGDDATVYTVVDRDLFLKTIEFEDPSASATVKDKTEWVSKLTYTPQEAREAHRKIDEACGAGRFDRRSAAAYKAHVSRRVSK